MYLNKLAERIKNVGPGALVAAVFASSGILGWGEEMKKTRFKVFWIIVLCFGIFATCTLGASPTQIILFAQAANAILLPVTGILLLIVSNDAGIMGEYKKDLVQHPRYHRDRDLHLHCGKKYESLRLRTPGPSQRVTKTYNTRLSFPMTRGARHGSWLY